MMGAMQPVTRARSREDLTARLAERTLELVNIPSISGEEDPILDHIAAALPEAWAVIDREGACLFASPPRRGGRPLVLLAGHVDTVPPQAGNDAGAIEDEGSRVRGLGASDMKGALAVMLEVADAISSGGLATSVDVGLLFFGREELPIARSALLPLLDRSAAVRAADLAIVMEPTSNALQIGCLGNLDAGVTFRGRSAHSARPWLGENAIHAAVRGLRGLADAGIVDVEVDGLVYREVASVTMIEGGVAANVIPAEVRCRVNLRYAPSRAPAEAEAWLLEMLAGSGAEIDVLSNAPPGPVSARNPLVARLRDAGGLAVGPKQAWTPVAEFATAGVDAVNFGPGDPALAHGEDELVEAASLARCFEVLAAFVAEADGTARP
jgi:succinyl-diaminopimelate desuccinylase